MKQLGLALHNYHDTFRTFPPALLGSGRYNNPNYHVARGGVKNTTGWTLMLPYFEQGVIADAYNFGSCSSMSSPYGATVAGTDMDNNALYNAKVAVLECPSHPEAGKVSDYDPGGTSFYARRNAIRTSYLFSTGSTTDYSAEWNAYGGSVYQGAFGNDGAARFAAITDGTSNTLALGEAAGGRFKTSDHYGPWGMTGTHTCCHGYVPSYSSTTLSAAYAAVYSADWNINEDYSADARRRSYAWVFSSLHPGGAEFVFTDGSVHFLAESIDYLTLQRLAYIHDGEPVGDY